MRKFAIYNLSMWLYNDPSMSDEDWCILVSPNGKENDWALLTAPQSFHETVKSLNRIRLNNVNRD